MPMIFLLHVFATAKTITAQFAEEEDSLDLERGHGSSLGRIGSLAPWPEEG